MVNLTPEDMDKAAEAFKAELDKLPQTVTVPMARLWKAHFAKAGHKRMGRMLVAIAKATEKLKDKDLTTAKDMEGAGEGEKFDPMTIAVRKLPNGQKVAAMKPTAVAKKKPGKKSARRASK